MAVYTPNRTCFPSSLPSLTPCNTVTHCNTKTRNQTSAHTLGTPTMIRVAPATLANAKSDAALGGAPGSKEPAQIKSNKHTKLNQAMPVRGTPQ